MSYVVKWKGNDIDFSKVEVNWRLNSGQIIRSLVLPKLNTDITLGDLVEVYRDVTQYGGQLLFTGKVVDIRHNPEEETTLIMARDYGSQDWLTTKYSGTFVASPLMTILDDILNTLDGVGKVTENVVTGESFGTGDGNTTDFNFSYKFAKYNSETVYVDSIVAPEGSSDTQKYVESSSTSAWTAVAASCETLDPDGDSTDEWASDNDYSSTSVTLDTDSSTYVDGSYSLKLSDSVAAGGSMWAEYTPDVSEDWSNYHYFYINLKLSVTTNVEVTISITDGTNTDVWTAYNLTTSWFKNLFALRHPGTVNLAAVTKVRVTVKNTDTASQSITLNFDVIKVGIHSYYSFDDAYTEVRFNEPPGNNASLTADYTYFSVGIVDDSLTTPVSYTWETTDDFNTWSTISGNAQSVNGKIFLLGDLSVAVEYHVVNSTNMVKSEYVESPSFEQTLEGWTGTGTYDSAGWVSSVDEEGYRGYVTVKGTDGGTEQDVTSLTNPYFYCIVEGGTDTSGSTGTYDVQLRINGTWTTIESHGVEDGKFYVTYQANGTVDGIQFTVHGSSSSVKETVYIDAVAYQASPTVTVHQAIANSTVEVYDSGGNLLGSGTADANGDVVVSVTAWQGHNGYLKIKSPNGPVWTTPTFFLSFDRGYIITMSGSSVVKSPQKSFANFSGWDQLSFTSSGSVSYDILDSTDTTVISGITTSPADISTVSDTKISVQATLSVSSGAMTDSVNIDTVTLSYFQGGVNWNSGETNCLNALKALCHLFQRDWLFDEQHRINVVSSFGSDLDGELSIYENVYKCEEGRDWQKYRNHIYIIGDNASGEAKDDSEISTFGDHAITIKNKDITDDVTASSYAEYVLGVLKDPKVVRLETEGFFILAGDKIQVVTKTFNEKLRAYDVTYIYDGVETIKIEFRTYIPTFEEFSKDINNLKRWI